MAKMTFTKMAAQIPDEASAYRYLEQLRWPSGTPECPHCGNLGANYIKALNEHLGQVGERRTRTGSKSQRRLWQCKACRKQFSAMTGTIFHGSKVPLRTWLFVLFEMVANKNGMAAREIERKYGVSPKTAWFMAHRIREAMKKRAPGMLRGIIVSDETYIGGDPTRMNKKTRRRWEGWDQDPTPVVPGTERPSQFTHKTPVMALIDADTGEARSAVIPNVTGATLAKVLGRNVDIPNSELWTDDLHAYHEVGKEFRRHEVVVHSDDEYVNGNGAGTNTVENFFSQLKRSLDGTHHHVSKEHLPRYLTEFDFRFSTRHLTDQGRMARLIEGADGRRLSYKRVKGS